MVWKKTTLFLFFLCAFSFSATRWGLPQHINISTYSIEDYSKTSSSNLSRSHKHAKSFSKNLFKKIASKYKDIATSQILERKDSLVTKQRILSDNLSHSEFVLFAGHGNSSGFFTYDGKFLSAGEKKFGQSTYWVIFDACLMLNNDLPTLGKWFDGAHAILGNKSQGWQYIRSYNCFFTCDHYRSEDQYSYFAKYFVSNGETIWESYKKAVKKAIYSNGNLGIEPAIVYKIGDADNGVETDMSEERFQNVYNAPFNPKTHSIVIKSIKYGKPKY